MLNQITHGAPTAKTPLLIAHGLYGSARNWGVIAKRMSDRLVVAVDMRNHGESGYFPTHSYFDMAGDLAEVIAQHGQMDVLGHSMGGKAAMVLALKHRHAVRRVIIADIAPTPYKHTQKHLIDAMQSVDLTRLERRSDAEEQLIDIDDPIVRSFILQSLDLKAKRWRLNLQVLGDEMDKIVGFPAISERFEGDILFLSGADSDYVTSDDRPRIKALFPKAKFARIPDAGHWLHAEKPREVEATARVFLDQ